MGSRASRAGIYPARDALAQMAASNPSAPYLRDECLNINLFWSLTQARVVITDWKDEYSHHRRHSALGYQTPGQLRCQPQTQITGSPQPADHLTGSG